MAPASRPGRATEVSGERSADVLRAEVRTAGLHRSPSQLIGGGASPLPATSVPGVENAGCERTARKWLARYRDEGPMVWWIAAHRRCWW